MTGNMLKARAPAPMMMGLIGARWKYSPALVTALARRAGKATWIFITPSTLQWHFLT
jgi:hypothetical protein